MPDYQTKKSLARLFVLATDRIPSCSGAAQADFEMAITCV